MSVETVGVQACRPEDRAMLATPAGAELVAKMAAALAAIDAAIGLPDDGCNSTGRTLAAVR